MDAVLVHGLPEAFAGIFLAALVQVPVDDRDVEGEIVPNPVVVRVVQDEPAQVVGVDDGMRVPAADGREREPGNLQSPDRLRLGIDGDGVAGEDPGFPGEREVVRLAPRVTVFKVVVLMGPPGVDESVMNARPDPAGLVLVPTTPLAGAHRLRDEPRLPGSYSFPLGICPQKPQNPQKPAGGIGSRSASGRSRIFR
jgi:hypothetical protein